MYRTPEQPALLYDARQEKENADGTSQTQRPTLRAKNGDAR
jgi:hypothetical protein